SGRRPGAPGRAPAPRSGGRSRRRRRRPAKPGRPGSAGRSARPAPSRTPPRSRGGRRTEWPRPWCARRIDAFGPPRGARPAESRYDGRVIVAHVAATNSADYLTRREAFRHAHIQRLLGLRERGLVVAGGPTADGRSAELFYRVKRPADLTALV